MPIVRLDGADLADWDSFHDVFSETFGFPDFYGRNLDAWIDCMTALDTPESGMTTVHGTASDPVVIHVSNAQLIPSDLFGALTECSAYVNWRRVEAGVPAILALSLWRG